MGCACERIPPKTQAPPFRYWTAVLVALPLLVLALAGDRRPTYGLSNETQSLGQLLPLRADLAPNDHVTANLGSASLSQVIAMYGELTGRTPAGAGWKECLNDLCGGRLSKWRLLTIPRRPSSLLSFHNDGSWRADELKATLETIIQTNGIVVIPDGTKHFQALLTPAPCPPRAPQSPLVSAQKVAY